MTILIQHPAVERLARELSLDTDRLLDACTDARVSVLDGVSLIALAPELPANRPVEPQENRPLSQLADERLPDDEKTVPPPAPPPAEMPEEVAAVLSKPSEPPRVWTPERDRLLVNLRSEGLLPREIFPRLNALPGIPVGWVDAVSQRISFMRRQGVLPRAEPSGAAGNASSRHKPAASSPAAATKPDASDLWTGERRELLRVCWERGDVAADIMQRLNELPGPAFTHPNAIYKAAAARQLRRLPRPVEPRSRPAPDGAVPMTEADVFNWLKSQGEDPKQHGDVLSLLRAANSLRDSLHLPPFYIDENVIDGNLDFSRIRSGDLAA